MSSTKPWENASGAADPTAYAATKSLEEEEKTLTELVKAIKILSRLAGFDITNRVEFLSHKTGRRYR